MEAAYPGSTFQEANIRKSGKTYTSEVFVMIEAKKQSDGSQSLLTLEHFKEMIDLDEYFLNIAATPEMADKLVSGKAPTLYDLCQKLNVTDEIVVEYAAVGCETNPRYCLPDIPEKCRVSPRPIDFVYDRFTDSYDLSPYSSDLELIGKV